VPRKVRYCCSGIAPSIRRKDQIISPKEAATFEVLKGHTGSCQRRTCLKWEINGELSALDRKNLMQLLCQVDKQACIDDVGLELDAETEMEGM
jgi:hypothetical protein